MAGDLAEGDTFFCFSVDFGFEGRKLALVWALAGFGLLRVLLLLGFIVVWFALGWIGVLFSFIFFCGVDHTQGLTTHTRQVLYH